MSAESRPAKILVTVSDKSLDALMEGGNELTPELTAIFSVEDNLQMPTFTEMSEVIVGSVQAKKEEGAHEDNLHTGSNAADTDAVVVQNLGSQLLVSASINEGIAPAGRIDALRYHAELKPGYKYHGNDIPHMYRLLSSLPASRDVTEASDYVMVNHTTQMIKSHPYDEICAATLTSMLGISTMVLTDTSISSSTPHNDGVIRSFDIHKACFICGKLQEGLALVIIEPMAVSCATNKVHNMVNNKDVGYDAFIVPTQPMPLEDFLARTVGQDSCWSLCGMSAAAGNSGLSCFAGTADTSCTAGTTGEDGDGNCGGHGNEDCGDDDEGVERIAVHGDDTTISKLIRLINTFVRRLRGSPRRLAAALRAAIVHGGVTSWRALLADHRLSCAAHVLLHHLFTTVDPNLASVGILIESLQYELEEAHHFSEQWEVVDVKERIDRAIWSASIAAVPVPACV